MSYSSKSYTYSFYIPSVPNHITRMMVQCIFRDNFIGHVDNASIVPYMCKRTHKPKNSVFVHMNDVVESEEVNNFLHAVKHKIPRQNRLRYIYDGREYYLVVKPYTSKGPATEKSRVRFNTSPKQRINLTQPTNDISDISVNSEEIPAFDHEQDDEISSVQDESLLNEKIRKNCDASVSPHPQSQTSENALIYDAEISDNKCIHQAVPSGHTLRLRTSNPLVDVNISVSLNDNPDLLIRRELPIIMKTHCKIYGSIQDRPGSPLHTPPSYCFY